MSIESPVQPDPSAATTPDPVWRTAALPGALPGDPHLRAWLEHRGSLTRRLQETRAAFSVEVTRESPEALDPGEARLLGVYGEPVPTRRVRLCCDGQALVYACTRIPAETLRRHPWLGELGASPLGEALAGRPGVTRSAFEYARLEAGHPLWLAALEGTEPAPVGLWARRSRFAIQGAGILVSEVFFPALLTLEG